jgi:selenide,water dikinase
MGGTPFLALNIAAFPPDLPYEITGQIVLGGAEKAKEAGVVIAGGHTIQDQEPKYGLIVVGFADSSRILTKSGAQPGDVLVLSKPLGFGTTTTALKNGKASPEDVQEVVDWMVRLNRDAAQLGLDHGVRGATDITGFSLLGHAWEMAVASKVGLRFEWKKIPFTTGALKYASDYIFPGGASDNFLYYSPNVEFTQELSKDQQLLLFDPQTSGGLLLSVPPNALTAMLTGAEEINQPFWVIGEVVEGDHIEIV